MPRALLLAGLLPFMGIPAAGQSAVVAGDPLVRAHELYNQQEYDEAIRLATEARSAPALADSAAVVLARAHLERYRMILEPADLEAARAAMLPIDRTTLSPRDGLDWTVAMGELLYFDRRFSTAAEFFEIALARTERLEPEAHDRLIEWWATSLDQQAQFGPTSARGPIYERILRRVEDVLRRDDESAVAAYWLAAAAAGGGDLERAWAAAEAGWLRASRRPEGLKLRDDLDQLVRTVIIPERARQISPADPFSAIDLLQQQWDGLKQTYGEAD
jgi:tetratricopeptide (TPR) repeat protein